VSWHYAARRVSHEDGDYFEVVEVYDLDGHKSVTEKAVHAYGDTVGELAKDLRMMADDIEEFPVE